MKNRAGRKIRVLYGLFITTVILIPLSADSLPEFYVNSHGIKMVLVRGGEFRMGNDLPTDPELLRQSRFNSS